MEEYAKILRTLKNAVKEALSQNIEIKIGNYNIDAPNILTERQYAAIIKIIFNKLAAKEIGTGYNAENEFKKIDLNIYKGKDLLVIAEIKPIPFNFRGYEIKNIKECLKDADAYKKSGIRLIQHDIEKLKKEKQENSGIDAFMIFLIKSYNKDFKRIIIRDWELKNATNLIEGLTLELVAPPWHVEDINKMEFRGAVIGEIN